MKIIKTASVILMASLISVAFGKEAATPFKVNCRFSQSRFVGDSLEMNNSDMASAQHLFLIQNTSKTPIYLDHSKTGGMGAGAGWLSRLDGQNWSAIALNEPKFMVNCTDAKSTNRATIACSKNVRVCVITGFKWEKQTDGNYWYSENKAYQPLLAAVTKRLSHHKS